MIVPAFNASLPGTTTGMNPTLISTTANAVNLALGNTLRGLTIGNTSGSKLNAGSSVGTLTIGPASGTSDVTLNGTGQALNLTGGGTLAARFASVSADGGTSGIVLTGMGGNLESPTTNIQNSTGIGINIRSSVAGGTFNFGSTTSNSSAGTGVALGGAGVGNANSITFAALNIAPDAGQRGLLAQNNTGTITSTSGTISAATNTAVEITGVSAVSTTPLNITLTSVSSASSAAPNGIILSNTSGAGFSVIGTGTAASGGTIVNKTGADANFATQGTGIYLNNAASVFFSRMQLNDFQNFAVRGTTVSDFSLTNSVISGISGNNASGGGSDEAAVSFSNLSGNSTISNSIISGGYEFNVIVINTSGAALNRFNFTNNTVNAMQASGNEDDSFHVEAFNSVTVDVTVSDSVFTSAKGDMINIAANQSSMLDLIFRRNQVNNSHPNILSGGGGTLIASGGAPGVTASMTYDISCNKFSGAKGTTLDVFKGNGNGSAVGSIINNTIGTATNNSGGDTGIRGRSLGGGTHTLLVKDNLVQKVINDGMLFRPAEGSSTMNLTLFNNTITAISGAFPDTGLFLETGALPGDTTTLNVLVGGTTAANKNNLGGTGGIAGDVLLLKTFGIFNLSRGGSVAGTATQIIKDDNNGNPSVLEAGPFNFVNTAPTLPPSVSACIQPLFGSIAAENKNDFDNAENTFNFSNLSSQEALTLFSCSETSEKQMAKTIESEKSGETAKSFETNEPASTQDESYLSSVTKFVGNVSGSLIGFADSLGSIISPTVYSQNVNGQITKDKQTGQLAGETICVDGDTNPACSGAGFTLPANESTTITFRAVVNANSTATSIPNTANVTAAGGINQNSNTVNTTVVQPPSISKAFAPVSISPNSTSTLTLTINNPNPSQSFTQLTFTDTFPSGLVVASPLTTGNTCNGTLQDGGGGTLGAGNTGIKLTGGTRAANGTCTVSVSVTGASEGTYNNTTGAVSSFEGGTGAVSNTATLTIINPPTLLKSFTPNQIQVNSTSSLQFTLTNPNTTLALNTLAFTDSLPSGITAPNTAATTVCTDGSYSITANVISFSKPSLAAGANCVFNVIVTGTSAGLKINTTSPVTTSNSSPGTAATANLTVIAAPTISKAFSPSMILSGGTSTVTLTLTNGNTTGALTNASFTDNLMNMSAAGGAVGGTCTGTTPNTLTTGTTALSFSGITIPNSGGCTVTFDVTSSTTGSHPNQTSGVTTTQTATAGAASNTVNLAVGNLVTWTGATSTSWNVAINWNPASVPTASNDVLIPSGVIPNEPGILTAATDVTIANLEIQPGRTLTINSGRTLIVTGTLTNNGTINNAGNFSFGSLNAGGSVSFTGTAPQTIPAGIYDNLTINNAAGVSMGGDVTTNNILTLTNGSVTTGAQTLIIGNAGSISRTSGYVIGNLQKNFAPPFNLSETNISSSDQTQAAPTAVFVYAVGTANGYSPATINVVSGSGSFTVSATQNFLAGANQTNSIMRYWSLTSNGITQADITFQYQDIDVPMGATESSFNFIRRTAGMNTNFPPSSSDTTTNTFTLNGVTQFSDWTLGNLAPTAASVEISGRVTDANGRGIYNATVTAVGSNGEIYRSRTNSFGYFRLTVMTAGETCVFSVRHKLYIFNPQVVTINDEITNLNFVALP